MDFDLSLEKGDIIEIEDHPEHEWFNHWAVYIGDGEGVHIHHHNHTIAKEKIGDITQNKKAIVRNIKDFNRDDTVERAIQRVGKKGFNFKNKWNSCRQFAEYCQHGMSPAE